MDPQAQSRRESRLRGKRLRVEVLLAGTTVPEPLPVHDLVEADLADLLALLPHADPYLQDEMQVAFHPTLTRVGSRKGRCGQRLVEAPGDNRKVYGFGLLDWRDGRVVPDVPLMSFASRSVLLSLALNSEDE